MDELIDEYHITLLNNLHHPAFIEERKQNIDSSAYSLKKKQKCKATIKEEKSDRHDSLDY